MALMMEPPREIALQVAVAWSPRYWRLIPRVDTKVPAGWRGGWSFTWWFINVQRWWRYV